MLFFIEIPPDQPVVNDDGKPIRFRMPDGELRTPDDLNFCVWMSKRLNDKQVNRGSQDLLTNTKLVMELRRLRREGAKYWAVEEDDYQFMKPTVETPTGGYQNEDGLARLEVPFIRAFLNPLKERPDDYVPTSN